MSKILELFNALPENTIRLILFIAGGISMVLSRIVVNVVSSRVKMILERPSLLLLEPDDQWQYIRWVPSERLGITWNTESAWKGNAESGHPPPSQGPIFGLKNIGTTSVEDIRVTWRVMSPHKHRTRVLKY